MAASDAKPVPQKNVAYRITFPILDADGDLVTGATGLDSEVSKDGGTFADCTNEATEIATSSGIYYLDLTSTEMNADTVAIIVKTSSSGAKTTTIVLYPEEAGDIRVNVTAFGGTAGTFSSGRPEVNTTHWGGTAVASTTVRADLINIAGAAVSTSTAQLGVNVVNAAGTAWGSGAITAASIATGAITSAKFAAGAIDAAAIANGAIDAATFAADVDAEILSYIVDDATRIDASALNTATGTTIPTNLDAAISTRATPAQVNTEVDTALADIHLDHLLAVTYDPASKPGAADALLNELVESDGGVSRFTANALEQAPTGGSAPTASQIADEVQTRTIAAVTTVGSVSGAVGSVTGAVGSVTGDVGGKVLGGGAGTITGTGVRADVRAWNGTAPGNLDANNYLPANVAAVNGNTTRANNLATSLDNYSATRGLAGTALPAAAAGAAGGIPTDSTGKTSFNDITAASVWAVGSRTLTSLSGLTVDTVTTLTNLPAITANWLTAAGLAADAGAEIAAAVRDVTLTGAASGGIGDGIVAAYTSAAEGSGYVQNLMNKLIVTTGTAQAGASSTITLASGASSTNNFYRNQIVYLHNGTGVGQSAVITAYNGTTKVATVAPNWNVTPDNTSNYVILSVAVANLDSGGYSLAKNDGGNSIATATDLATVDGIVDAILEDTGTTIPAQIAALNNLSAAQVNAEVDTALADYDGPTNAEMVARTLAAADYATATNLATVDTVVDAIKAKTDSLTFTVAGQVDANVQYVNDTQVGGTGASGDEWGPV